MERYELIIDEDGVGKRVDAVLAKMFNQFSRTQILKIIEQGDLYINEGLVKKANTKLKLNDSIRFEYTEVTELDLQPEEMELNIVYEDEDVMVIDKPRNLVVHPANGNATGTLVNGLVHYAQNHLSNLGGEFRPGIVHRIDKDTSGLLMIAKNNYAHQKLSDQLRAKTVNRKYVALVHGVIGHDKGTIDAPLGISQVDRKKRAVTSVNSKQAITHFNVLKRADDYTLVQCQLETGRTHQIRVHFQYIKHPLVGDPKYYLQKKQAGTGQYLHAYTLGFVHPKTEQYMEFHSPIPAYFQKKLEEVGIVHEL